MTDKEEIFNWGKLQMDHADAPIIAPGSIKIEPIEIENMDTLLEVLEEEQERPCYNSFLDLNEPEIVDEFTYEQMRYDKYGYAVNGLK